MYQKLNSHINCTSSAKAAAYSISNSQVFMNIALIMLVAVLLFVTYCAAVMICLSVCTSKCCMEKLCRFNKPHPGIQIDEESTSLADEMRQVSLYTSLDMDFVGDMSEDDEDELFFQPPITFV